MRVHELHAPVKVVSRGSGRSATAAAAYRTASLIEDERTGQIHDYTRKQGIEADALLLPENAPEWAHDRARLWNAAEMNEKHPRAQTAREVTISFPSEFSAEQRREAGLKIGQWIMFRHGVAVDIAWHEPSRDGDQRNHHMHALFATRRFDENGEWAKVKDRTLDDLKKGPEEIKAMRLGIADALNNIAARDRLDVYTEHLSFEARGVDREATQHVGPIATQMERDGLKTEIGEKNRAIAARNEERRQLENEQKVIDIEIARERLKAAELAKDQLRKAAALKAEREAQGDAAAVFYRETHERRAAMLDALDNQHGGREKELRQQIAGLASTMESAGFFTRIWRGITGKSKADREEMTNASRALKEIQRQRQAAQEAFEKDRVTRLEALKADEQRRREAQAKALSEPLARAVGDPSGMRPQPAQARPEATEHSPAPAESSEARRRAYFQRLGQQRKAERERQQGQQSVQAASPTHAVKPERKPSLPEPNQELEQAADGKNEPSVLSPALSQNDKTASYEERKAAYMRRIRQQREQRPDHDRGPHYER